MKQATGSFEVKSTTLPVIDLGDGAVVGHTRIEKVFSGDFVATSVVEMLAVMNMSLGSGAYVAIERLKGTLDGRTGSFFAQHNGVMTRGQGTLTLTVVPDSGTDGFSGLSGQMQIEIKDQQHYYTFDYSLA